VTRGRITVKKFFNAVLMKKMRELGWRGEREKAKFGGKRKIMTLKDENNDFKGQRE